MHNTEEIPIKNVSQRARGGEALSLEKMKAQAKLHHAIAERNKAKFEEKDREMLNEIEKISSRSTFANNSKSFGGMTVKSKTKNPKTCGK